VSPTIGERAVVLAATTVGIAEVGGPNEGPPSVRFAGGRREPWCAHWVAWVYRSVGYPLPGDVLPTRVQHNPLASVIAMWESLDAAGWTMPRAATLFPGDLFFSNNRGQSDAGDGWHVGIVTAIEGNITQCISANWRDRVARHHIHRRGKNIVGFARVRAQ